MQLTISHVTEYHYDQPVPFGLQELRLTPRSSDRQQMRVWDVAVEGGDTEVSFTDHHGNRVHLISLLPGHHTTTIRCHGTVDTTDTAGVTAALSGVAPLWLYRRSTPLTEAGEGVARVIEAMGDHDTDDALGRLHALATAVEDVVAYEPGWTDASTSAEEAVRAGRGVCQDHAHVFVAAARSLGFPARYVSGYLVMDDDHQQAMHAWADAWVHDLGWVGFDPSNGICPDERYVSIAVGLDYREAAPISGLRFGNADERLDVSVHIEQ